MEAIRDSFDFTVDLAIVLFDPESPDRCAFRFSECCAWFFGPTVGWSKRFSVFTSRMTSARLNLTLSFGLRVNRPPRREVNGESLFSSRQRIPRLKHRQPSGQEPYAGGTSFPRRTGPDPQAAVNTDSRRLRDISTSCRCRTCLLKISITRFPLTRTPPYLTCGFKLFGCNPSWLRRCWNGKLFWARTPLSLQSAVEFERPAADHERHERHGWIRRLPEFIFHSISKMLALPSGPPSPQTEICSSRCTGAIQLIDPVRPLHCSWACYGMAGRSIIRYK